MRAPADVCADHTRATPDPTAIPAEAVGRSHTRSPADPRPDGACPVTNAGEGSWVGDPVRGAAGGRGPVVGAPGPRAAAGRRLGRGRRRRPRGARVAGPGLRAGRRAAAARRVARRPAPPPPPPGPA